jgi:hypothetical protein
MTPSRLQNDQQAGWDFANGLNVVIIFAARALGGNMDGQKVRPILDERSPAYK